MSGVPWQSVAVGKFV